MEQVSIERITARLWTLSPEKLEIVSDFVSYLVERQQEASSSETMLASEPVLARDWNRPEEDDAWADL
jgi:hypothetical protein